MPDCLKQRDADADCARDGHRSHARVNFLIDCHCLKTKLVNGKVVDKLAEHKIDKMSGYICRLMNQMSAHFHFYSCDVGVQSLYFLFTQLRSIQCVLKQAARIRGIANKTECLL